MKLVSVVIPTYNRAHCLARTIDSALQQTYSCLEVIVVDDGSTDGTPDLIRRRYGNRISYVYQENSGASSARNAAFRIARGEYIALLDSDDVWRPWKIELQVACMQARPEIGMIWTDMTGIASDGTVISDRYMRQMYAAYRYFRKEDLFHQKYPLSTVAPSLAGQLPNAHLYVGDAFSQIVIGNLVTTPTVLLSRERLALVKGFDTELRDAGEDHDFHLRTSRYGPVGFIDLSSVDVQRGRPDQLTTGCKLPIAINYLKTLSRALMEDRDRITLPDSLIRSAQANAHQWVGYLLMAQEGRIAEARRHLCRSLRYRAQLKTLSYLAKSIVPRSIWPALRGIRRYANKQPNPSGSML